MYPRNAASPPRIAVGAIYQISDGALVTSGASVAVRAEGGAEGAGGGTLAYGASGTIYYTPTQAETDYTAFCVTVYKASCTSASVTVITTESAVAGRVSLGAILGTAPTETSGGYLAAAFTKLFDVASPVLTTESVNQTGDVYAQLPSNLSGLSINGSGQVQADVELWLGTTVPTFPTNFADLAITATTGIVTAAVTSIGGQTVTADTAITMYGQVGTIYGITTDINGYVTSTNAGSGATAQQVWEYATRTLSAATNITAGIATAVWQDATAGDFTTSGSIGKSLFTSGAVPGASGGLLIAGNNYNTTFAAVTLTAGTIPCDVQTFKGQTVTCAGAVTILASVGTSATSTAQTGDSYALVNSGTYGLSAIKTAIGTPTDLGNGTATLAGNLADIDATMDAGVTLASGQADAVATALLDLANGVETGITVRKALRAATAVLCGLIDDAGTGTETFVGMDKTTTRVTVTVDSSGNRSGVTYTL